MHSTFRRSIGARITSSVMILVFGSSAPLTALAAAQTPGRAAELTAAPFTPPGHLATTAARLEPDATEPPSDFADLAVALESGTKELPLAIPVVPLAARVVGGTAEDAWAVLDGNARTKLRSVRGEPTRLELDFAEATTIGELTIQGPAQGQLRVLVQTEWGLKPVSGFTDVAVSVGAGRSQRISASEPLSGSRVVVEWNSADTSGPVEIGFWSHRTASRIYQETQLADQIIAGTLPGALAMAASPPYGSVGTASSAEFQFELHQSPRAITRAFLVYELVGASHWTGVTRSINGGQPQGGFAPRWGKGGGLQVEEVSPAWLVTGVNRVRFERTAGPSAAIRNLRLVIVANGGFVASSQPFSRLGENAPPSELKRGLRFDTPSQPHYLTFQLSSPGKGKLELTVPSSKRPTKLNIELDGLGVGWHRYPLDHLLAPVNGLDFRYQAAAVTPGKVKGGTGANILSDIFVAASRIVGESQPRLAVTYPLHGECVDGKAYIRGFVVGEGSLSHVALAGADVLQSSVGRDGSYSFEANPSHDGTKPWSVNVSAKLDSGKTLSQSVPIAPCVVPKMASDTLPRTDEGAPYGEWVQPDKASTFTYAGVTLKIPAGAVAEATRITVRPLVREQVTPMNRAMVNVTPGGRAYRFGPHGIKFKKPIAIELPYERVTVPSGYEEGNISSYYFDETRSEWVKVGRLDAPKDGRLASLTDHFTDFVNATIAMPDSPGTKSFNPSELKGMKLGSPSAGVTLIQPPGPNAQGSANLEYPLEVPPGRNNVQPLLALTYNSQGDSSWLGVGWDLELSRIAIDTRFGVPRYDGSEEYVLDGQKIVPVSNGSNFYRRRVEGPFDRIEHVNGGGQSHWVVTSKSGTTFYYGQTANARLADPATASHVSEWRLERVVDRFNNEMSVAYTHDQSTLGAQPYDYVYPSRIDYTTNTLAGITSSYSVEFHLDDGLPDEQRRKDVKIDGRSGFLTVQRHRLDHVDVRYDSQLIRRYQFAYKEGDFRKSLLESVAHQGRTGEELYRHAMQYFDDQRSGTDTSTGTPTYSLFDDAVAWGTAQNGIGAPRSEHGMVRNEGNLKGLSGELGVGIGPISITAGGGGNDGDDKTILRFLDLNGDGLPDSLDQSGRASINLLGRPANDHLEFLPTAVGDKRLGFSDQDGWSVQGNLNVAGIVGGTASYSRTGTEDENTVSDINGDGLVDLLRIDDGNVLVRLNNKNNGFLAEQSWGSLSANDILNTRADRAAQAAARVHLIDPLIRWVAPFAGTIDVSGAVQRLAAGGDGVGVQLYQNGSPVWSRNIAASDMAACSPGSGNSCAGDLNLTVSAGDRVYAKTSSINDTKNDVVLWSPTFTYRKSPGELALLEPYGRPMYRFSQQDDFRVAGMPTPRWVASANGTVHLFGNLAKLTTSDDVQVHIVRTRAGIETELLSPVPMLGGGAVGAVPVDMTLPVLAGDDIRFQIDSQVQVDPLRITWTPRIEYTDYCRVSPDTSTEVCGAVSCVTNAEGRNVCNIAGDPVPDIPIPEEIIKQDAFVGYSTFEWLPRAETSTFAASGAMLAIAGTLSKPTTSSAIVLVQAVNRLIHKQEIPAGTTTATIVASGNASAGEQLFITVLTDQSSAGSVTFAPVVNGASVPVNIRYPDPAFGINPFSLTPMDGMAGGFHHWYFGDWNGSVAFNPVDVHYNDPTLGDPYFMFAAPVYFDIAAGTRVPAWVGRGDGAYIAAGQINPARLGNLMPGLGASGSLKALRLADTWNFTLTATVATISGSISFGDTVTSLDLLDLNGDRYPDSVYADGVRYNTRGGFGAKEGSNLGFGDLRRIEHRNASFKAGLTKELINKTDAKGNTKALVQTGFSVGVDYGLSGTHVDLVDMNGDGLPDHVKQDPDSGSLKVRLNLGYGFTDEISWGGGQWHKSGIDPGAGVGGDIQQYIGKFVTETFGQAVRSNVVRLQDNGNNSVGVGIDTGMVGGGGGVTFGINRTYVDLMDLTGDGLPEHVFRDADSNDLYVKLNLGDRFSAPVKWQIPSWGSIDVGPSDWALLGKADALTFARNKTYSGSFSFKVCFIVCVGASGFWSENRSDSNMAFDDIDGDGNADQVLKQDGNATVYVKKNRLQKTNLLRKVSRPLGGEFELEYARQGNLVNRSDATAVVDMPNNQWALTSVVTRDGAGNSYANSYQYHQSGYYDRTERENYGFARVTTTREDGSTVDTAFHNQDYYRKGLPKTTYERDAAGQLYTAEVTSYREPGSLPEFTGSFFPGERERRSRFYEGQTNDPALFGKETHETRTYDVDLGEAELGNVRFYRTYGEESTTTDDVIYEVGYDIRPDGLVRANSVVGRDVSGNVLRERQSIHNANGAMTSLTNVVTGGRNAAGVPYAGTPATYAFTYDNAGNLASVAGPNGYTTTYGYDSQTLTYKTSATDSFGYVSSSVPNYYFGAVATMTDINGQQIQYDYDAFGRLIRAWGPTDLGSLQPTLAFEYQLQPGYVAPGSGTFQPMWARTLHKDVTAADADPLVTVTFVDGLDRVIQTKKDLEKDNGTNTVIGMSVSGRVEFDARGRLRRQSQPVFQNISLPSHLPGSEAVSYVDTGFVRPTQFSYDILGRTLAVQTPDGHQTTTSYGFGNLDSKSWFVTAVTDANSKQRLSYTDVGQRVGAVQEFNTLGAGGLQTLTTRYTYNPMDELLLVRDAAGNTTSAQYDTAGRMVALTSPDQGRTEWGYDLAGNLVAKETARLRALGQKVLYEYEYNRLARIDFPGTQTDVTYDYGDPIEAGSAAGNLAGRVKQEVNEAGWRRFYYDELGNVATRETSFERMREPHLGPYVETVSYKFDPFGRVLQIRFPGSNHEVVAYGYDRGGLVKSAFGLNTTINAQHPDESPNTIYFEHIGYDEFEQRVRTIHGNALETTYQYDPNTRRLTEINAAHKDPTLRAAGLPARQFQNLRYGYDAVGNILQSNNVAPYDEQMNASVLVGTVNQSFTYDDLYQLKTATGLYQNRHDWRWGYTYSQNYDAIGNITHKEQDSYREKYENGGYVFDHNEILQSFRNDYEYSSGRPHAPSRVNEYVPPETQARVIDLSYDASGNQIRRLYRNSEPRTITWDADDRVKVVNLNGQDMSIMRYDGAGERAVHFHHVSGLEETAYMDQHLTIRDGRYHTKHIFAGATRMASKMDPDWFQYPPTLYYHPDHLGSTNFVSNDEQTLTQHDEYFPSGERWWDETDSRYELYKSYIFSGKELDQAIGLYYYGARYYDARQGQWISPDPILSRYMQGAPNKGAFQPINLSVYSYAYNNPIALTDPDGKTPAAACALVWIPGVGQAVCAAGLITAGVLVVGAAGVAVWHATSTTSGTDEPIADAPAPAPGQAGPKPPPPPQGPPPLSPEAAAAAAAAASAANSPQGRQVLQQGGQNVAQMARVVLSAGKNFKDHFLTKRPLLERALDITVGKFKEGGGQRFLDAIGKGISDGRFKYVGQGTLKKGAELMNIYRGEGVTVVTKTSGEFVTLLKSGEGLDKAIQMAK